MGPQVRGNVGPAMGAGVDTYRARVVLELRKPNVEKELRSLAHWLVRSREDAKELLQTALMRVVDPRDAPWDPGGPKDFVHHVGSVMSNLAANDRRNWKAKHEVLDPNVADDDRTADGAPPADEAIAEGQDAARWAQMRATLLGELDRSDPEAAAVFRAIRDGIGGHPAIAAHAGIEIERVRHAYDRIKYRARVFLDQQQDDDLGQTRRRREAPVRATMKEDPS
jgi:DNA-directed RNA polymerase specialized sigma24 family protein